MTNDSTEVRDEFDFNDITPASRVVKIGGKSYTLHEASTDAACRYRNKHFSGAKYGDGKLERMEGIADADPLLLSCCLTDETNKMVTLEVIKKWPERIVKPMVAWIKENSEIDSGEDPLKVALQEGFKRDDAPISFDTFCDWVRGWDDASKEDKKLRHLYRLLKTTFEERAKNVQEPTPASSA